MFLGPVLEYRLEVGAYFVGLLKHLLGLLVQVKLHTVTHNHQVQYEALVLRLVVRVTNHILNQLQIVCDKFLLDVPIGLPDHVRQENNLNLVEQENFTDRFEHLENWILGSVLTRFGYAIQEWVNPFHVVLRVKTEKLRILRGNIVYFVVLFAHLTYFLLVYWLIMQEIKSGQVLF